MPRCRLRTVFLIVLVSAVGSWNLNEYLRSRPPSQETYSATELQRQLSEGRPVLLTIDAVWAMKSSARPRYMSPDVSRRIRDKGLATLTADWTNNTPAITELLASVKQHTVPVLVLYSPKDPKNPIVLSHNPSDSQVLGAIDAILE